MAAPSAIAFILPKATARGRYFMPQSGATTSRSAGDIGQRPTDAIGDDVRRFDSFIGQIDDTQDNGF